jgi:hypothetical protein
MNTSHKLWANRVLRIGLALTLLWSVKTKLGNPEAVRGLFNNLGFTFVTPGLVTVIAIGLLVISLLLITGKYLQIAGSLLVLFFLGALISGALAGDAAFSIGPGIWKDFALLGAAGFFALGGGEMEVMESTYSANSKNIDTNDQG